MSALRLYASQPTFTLDRLCNNARVGKGTFYTFYADKDDLQQEVRRYVSERCWNEMISCLGTHPEDPFPVKVQRSTDFLVNYVKTRNDFRNATAGIAVWPYGPEELLARTGEDRDILIGPMIEYAAACGRQPEELAFSLLFLETGAVLDAYLASRSACADYERVKKDLRMTAGRLL